MEQDTNELLISFGGEIKALGNGRVGGYLVRFTDENAPDLEGDFFTKDTDYDFIDGDPATVYYHHGYDPYLGHRKLSKGSMKMDDVGVWIEAQLKLRDEYELAVYQMALEGKLGWSSGTLNHLVQRERKGAAYWIKSWPLGKDATMTPTPAAGPQLTSVTTLKAYKQLAEAIATQETQAESDQEIASPDVTASEGDAGNIKSHGENIMTEEVKVEEREQPAPVEAPEIDYEKIIKGVVKAFEPMAERIEKLEKQEVEVPEVAKKNVNIALDTEHWKYDNIDSGELATMVGVLDTAKRYGQSRNGASTAAYKALAHRLESQEAEKSEPARVARRAFKSLGIKANEIAQSTLASYGDEWVGVYYSGNLWEQIRHATFVLPRISQFEVPAGAESVVIPLESTDPVWKKVAQSSALSADPGGVPTNTVASSRLGTGQVQLTLGKMGARVLWTGELEEDSIIPYVAQLQNQLAVSGAEYMEHVLIDGDTATGATTNINDIGGTPAGTEAFLILNGFRKSPLVTTNANSRSGGTLTEEDFLETIKLMGQNGRNAADKTKVSFIIDPATHWKALELTQVKTRDIFGNPTIENGMLTGIWGYEVLTSMHMHKANADATYGGLANTSGKLDLDTASNNTTGVILAVRWDQWQLGWRRRMTLETTRIPAADATEIVSLMRFGMIQRDTEASAISYNITV